MLSEAQRGCLSLSAYASGSQTAALSFAVGTLVVIQLPPHPYFQFG
jgi:hypothetical protein